VGYTRWEVQKARKHAKRYYLEKAEEAERNLANARRPEEEEKSSCKRRYLDARLSSIRAAENREHSVRKNRDCYLTLGFQFMRFSPISQNITQFIGFMWISCYISLYMLHFSPYTFHPSTRHSHQPGWKCRILHHFLIDFKSDNAYVIFRVVCRFYEI